MGLLILRNTRSILGRGRISKERYLKVDIVNQVFISICISERNVPDEASGKITKFLCCDRIQRWAIIEININSG